MSTPHQELALATEQRVENNTALGDINIAGRDNIITKYLSGLRRLRPRPVDPSLVMAASGFAAPAGFDTAMQAIRSTAFSPARARVVVLRARESSGRRSAAMRLLAATQVPEGRHFELLPDWDEPDVGTLPDERSSAYLLNLRGVVSPLPAAFLHDLVNYASTLSAANSYLIITASSDVWPWRPAQAGPGIAVVDIARPIPRSVVERHLPTERAPWLDDGASIFSGVLPPESAPGEAIRLADVMTRATGPNDKERLDEYDGWVDTISNWFLGGSNGVETRAIRIAGAVLDTAPAAVILDSADTLLREPEIDLPREAGGLLARPDAKRRLEPADMVFDPQTGTARLIHASQGPALLTYLWTTHIQLSQVLTRWLQEISSGPAKGHLDALARSLTTLAQTVGTAPILQLADGWLAMNDGGSIDLVGDLLSDLAVHPTLGGNVRPELAKWASGKSQPARQQAVARAVTKEFGQIYTSQALNRIRSLLKTAGSDAVRQRALQALRHLVASPELTASTIDALVKWISVEAEKTVVDAQIFLDVLAPFPDGKPAPEPLRQALSHENEAGQAIHQRLVEGWFQVTSQEGQTKAVKKALLEWQNAAEANLVPAEAFVEFMVSLGRRMGHTDSLFLSMVTEVGTLQSTLITRILADVQDALDRASQHRDAIETASTAVPDDENDQG